MLAYYIHAPYRDPDGPDAKVSDFDLWGEPETADDVEEEVTDFGWLAMS